MTLADLARGTSVVGDRGTTFFDREPGGPGGGRDDERAPATRTDQGETVVPEPPPAEETQTTPPETEPDPATTATTEPTPTTPTTTTP